MMTFDGILQLYLTIVLGGEGLNKAVVHDGRVYIPILVGAVFVGEPFHLSFQFPNFPTFLDGFLIIELHFKRIITLQQFIIMAPCQFVGQCSTFWECQV